MAKISKLAFDACKCLTCPAATYICSLVLSIVQDDKMYRLHGTGATWDPTNSTLAEDIEAKNRLGIIGAYTILPSTSPLQSLFDIAA